LLFLLIFTGHIKEKMKVKEPLFDYIHPDTEYQVKDGDSSNVLRTFEDGKFDLILTSPPYNVGKSNIR